MADADRKHDQTTDEPLSERIIIPISKSLASDIKDYWHEHRLNSRSEAVRALIMAGLNAAKSKS